MGSMSGKTFYGALVAFLVGVSPVVVFGWIWLVATVDFGDTLAVVCVLVVQYEIRALRKEERATYRAIRKVQARTILRKNPADLLTNDDDERMMAA